MTDQLLDVNPQALPTATYYKGSGLLRLSGQYTATNFISNVRFQKSTDLLGVIAYDVRGQVSTPPVLQYNKPIPDMDVTIALPSKTIGSEKLQLVTKSKQLPVVIKYVDGNAPASGQSTSSQPSTSGGQPSTTTSQPNPSAGQPKTTGGQPTPNTSTTPAVDRFIPEDEEFQAPGGDRGILQTMESVFAKWLDGAAQAVKAKYPSSEPILIQVNANRIIDKPRGPMDTLGGEAYYRIWNDFMVFVNGDPKYEVSRTIPVIRCLGDITDMKKVMLTLYNTVNGPQGGSKLAAVNQYAEISISRPLTLPDWTLTDQPYIDFTGANGKRAAVVGAWDGKQVKFAVPK